MSYYPRMPPPRPSYQGYYGGEYDDYGSYGGYGYSYGGYGSPRPPSSPRGAWRGRGRGGWVAGRGGSSGGGGSAVVTVKTSSAATALASSAATTVVKTEPKEETVVIKTEPKEEAVAPPAGAAKSASSSVPNGAPASATAAATTAGSSGGQTTTTTGTRTTAATAAPASSTTSTASSAVTTKASSTTTATASKATATTAAATATATATATAANKATGPASVDTPLSDDHPFPESVTEKFFPNRCDLCSVLFPVGRDIIVPEKGGMDYMENNLQSTMHYSGKCHKKRLRQFMQDYCRRHRLVTPRRARELMKDSPAVPRTTDAQETPKVDLYCKACDLSFTSVQHASQHYAGKNHQRKVEGKPPLKTGYFNARTGRWQRLPPGQELERPYQPRLPVRGAAGPRPGAPATTTTAADPSVITVQVAPGNLVNAGVKLSPTVTAAGTGTGTGVQSKFYCEICSVSATCQLQLDTHMTGSRHKLQARKLGLPVPVDKPVSGAEAGSSDTAEPAAKRPRRDYSIYKTPSGKFYCLPCDLTMNSETQFAQHFESKKHHVEVAKQRKAGVVAA